jgi:hypothetical protein
MLCYKYLTFLLVNVSGTYCGDVFYIYRAVSAALNICFFQGGARAELWMKHE